MSRALRWGTSALAAFAMAAAIHLNGPDDIQHAQDQADDIAAITESEE